MTKYKAKVTHFDGIRFDSKREAARYQELKLLESGGLISELELQPAYELQPAFRDKGGKHHRSIRYIADFRYADNETGKTIVEDVKGVETAVFKIKRKMLLYVHGVQLTIVK